MPDRIKANGHPKVAVLFHAAPFNGSLVYANDASAALSVLLGRMIAFTLSGSAM